MGDGVSPVQAKVGGSFSTSTSVELGLSNGHVESLFADFFDPREQTPADQVEALARAQRRVEDWYLLTTRKRYAVDYLPYSDDFDDLVDQFTQHHDTALRILSEQWPNSQYKSVVFRFVQRLRKAKRLARGDQSLIRSAPIAALSKEEELLIYRTARGNRGEVERLPYTAGFDKRFREINAIRMRLGSTRLREHECWCAIMRYAKTRKWRKPTENLIFEDAFNAR